MFNLKPENMNGDTNKLLFAILKELKQLNESLHPIAKDTVVQPAIKPIKPRITKPRNKPKPIVKRGKKIDNNK